MSKPFVRPQPGARESTVCLAGLPRCSPAGAVFDSTHDRPSSTAPWDDWGSHARLGGGNRKRAVHAPVMAALLT